MLDFYVEMKRQAGQEAPPLIPLEYLQAFYAIHTAPLPQLPAPRDVVGALIMEEDVKTRDKMRQAFHMVKDNFVTMGEEHAHMK